MLRVTLLQIDQDPSELVPETDTFDVDYVSLVNRSTFGPPPLVAPKDSNPPVANDGETVIYINTDLVPAWMIERLET